MSSLQGRCRGRVSGEVCTQTGGQGAHRCSGTLQASPQHRLGLSLKAHEFPGWEQIVSALHTRGQALGPSRLHQFGIGGDGLADAAQAANLFEEVEAVIIDDAALSQGDTTARAGHVRHMSHHWQCDQPHNRELSEEWPQCWALPEPPSSTHRYPDWEEDAVALTAWQECSLPSQHCQVIAVSKPQPSHLNWTLPPTGLKACPHTNLTPIGLPWFRSTSTAPSMSTALPV